MKLDKAKKGDFPLNFNWKIRRYMKVRKEEEIYFKST